MMMLLNFLRSMFTNLLERLRAIAGTEPFQELKSRPRLLVLVMLCAGAGGALSFLWLPLGVLGAGVGAVAGVALYARIGALFDDFPRGAAQWLLVLLAVVVTFAFGWAVHGAQPPRVEVHEVWKTKYEERVVERIKRVRVRDEQRQLERHRVEERRPDGSARITEHVVRGMTLHSGLQESSARVAELAASQSRELQVLVTPPPAWMVGAMVGRELGGAAGWTAGAHVQRRVAGPVWLGAWGLTSGAAGASLSVELP